VAVIDGIILILFTFRREETATTDAMMMMIAEKLRALKFQWITDIAEGPKLFQRLRSEKVAPARQLSEPKLELQLSNRDKPEITNHKHQITSKFQITISKSAGGGSKAKCLDGLKR
jgi:hypothetical protein